MSSHDFQQMLIFVGIMTAMGCVTKIALAIIGRVRAPRQETAKIDDLSERITQLQTSVDAMAVEIERIGEGQRFAVRLMSKGEAELPASTH